MGFMVWSDKLAVNVTEIDNQHKHLIDLINKLHNAMMVGKGKDVLLVTLDELAKYTVEHFSAEEKLMQKYAYSEYPAHKVEHEFFVEKVLTFQKSFKMGEIGLTIDVMDFLRDWTVNHIAETDKKLELFFHSKGLK